MKVLLGKKIEMTQLFKEDGTVVPVTLIEMSPNTVAAVKVNPQGVKTMVLGFGSKKSVSKPQRVEWKGLDTFAYVVEVPINEGETVERGQKIGADLFTEGEKVNVVGVSKGKGFQGVVKRHGFKGGPASHGHKDQLRMPGSIGPGGPQKVFKGTKMGGRMGGDQTTVKNLEIISIDTVKNIVAVKGAIPGSRGSHVKLMSTEGNVWQK